MVKQLYMMVGYLAVLLMPALLALGVWQQQPYLAFGMVMLVFPLARGIFGAHTGQAPIQWNERVASVLDRLPVIYAFALLVAMILVAWRIDNGAATSPAGALGIGLSLWMTLLFATCPAHELIHRRSVPEVRIGCFVAGLAGYPWLGYEHLRHHARYSDTARAEWPRLSESVWRFAARRIHRIAREVIASGREIWRYGGAVPASTRVGEAAATTIGTWAAFTWAGGWTGFVIYLSVIVGVTVGVQMITYLQHWGLGDDSLADADVRQFAWEDDCLFQAWVTLNISFHQAHHQAIRLPYYRVTLAHDSPRQPAGYVILLVACMFPRLWQRLMLPALTQWKQQPHQAVSPGRRLTCFARY